MTDGSPGRTKGPLVKRGLAKISDFGLGDCFAGTRERFCRLLVPYDVFASKIQEAIKNGQADIIKWDEGN